MVSGAWVNVAEVGADIATIEGRMPPKGPVRKGKKWVMDFDRGIPNFTKEDSYKWFK